MSELKKKPTFEILLFNFVFAYMTIQSTHILKVS